MSEDARRRALVLAAGDLEVTPRLRAIAAAADLVVAADGGLRHAEPLGVAPALVVGDFDSVTPEDLERFPDAPRERHPRTKGALDLELAIEAALRRGSTDIVAMGVFGTRLDQTLAALLIAARLQREGVTCTLHGCGMDAFPLAPGDALQLDAEPRTRFSVVALSDGTRLSIEGAEYPVQRAELPFGVGLGVSNRVAGSGEVSCHDGLLVVLLDRSDEGGSSVDPSQTEPRDAGTGDGGTGDLERRDHA